jgi:hypothetical protein
MKPQNYSLKFQNSLADSRITPGSQHGKARGREPDTRNGLRAIRKLTKRELSAVTKKKQKQKKMGGPEAAVRNVGKIEMVVEAEKANDAKCLGMMGTMYGCNS